jgi:nitrite reductase/ring-hydroxylating ferredoxin subunit
VRYVVGTIAEVPPGGRKIITVEGRSIGIFNIDGEWFALRNLCPHQGAPLCTGRLWGLVEGDVPGDFRYDPRRRVVSCPWHGWEFDIMTGRSVCEPVRLRARSYDVEVRPGRELTPQERPDGQVTSVDTFHLEAEGDYLVLDTGRRGT